MNWKKLNSIKDLPKDRTFLLWDDKATSGLRVYEAMLYDDETIGCPANHESFDIKEFSHWCEIGSPHVIFDYGAEGSSPLVFTGVKSGPVRTFPKIPKRFKLMGREFEVVFEKQSLDREQSSGRCFYMEGKIMLRCPDESHSLDYMGQTFFHELVHAMLLSLNLRDLSEDEKLVDQMSGLFYQFLKTAEYE